MPRAFILHNQNSIKLKTPPTTANPRSLVSLLSENSCISRIAATY